LNSRTHDIEDPSKTLDVENVASAERSETIVVQSMAAPQPLVNTDETVDHSTSIPSVKSVPVDGEVINALAADLAGVSVSSEKKTTPSTTTESESKSLKAYAKSTQAEKKTTSSIKIETEPKSTEVPAKSTIPLALEGSMAETTKIAEKSTSVEELNQKPDLKQT